MAIKDAFEMLIKIFHRDGTQFVKDPSHFDPLVGVRVASILGRHQQPVCLLTVLAQFRRVVMTVTQDETDFGGHFSQQIGRRVTIGDIGGSLHGSDRKPDRCLEFHLNDTTTGYQE